MSQKLDITKDILMQIDRYIKAGRIHFTLMTADNKDKLVTNELYIDYGKDDNGVPYSPLNGNWDAANPPKGMLKVMGPDKQPIDIITTAGLKVKEFIQNFLEVSVNRTKDFEPSMWLMLREDKNGDTGYNPETIEQFYRFIQKNKDELTPYILQTFTNGKRDILIPYVTSDLVFYDVGKLIEGESVKSIDDVIDILNNMINNVKTSVEANIDALSIKINANLANLEKISNRQQTTLNQIETNITNIKSKMSNYDNAISKMGAIGDALDYAKAEFDLKSGEVLVVSTGKNANAPNASEDDNIEIPDIPIPPNPDGTVPLRPRPPRKPGAHTGESIDNGSGSGSDTGNNNGNWFDNADRNDDISIPENTLRLTFIYTYPRYMNVVETITRTKGTRITRDELLALIRKHGQNAEYDLGDVNSLLNYKFDAPKSEIVKLTLINPDKWNKKPEVPKEPEETNTDEDLEPPVDVCKVNLIFVDKFKLDHPIDNSNKWKVGTQLLTFFKGDRLYYWHMNIPEGYMLHEVPSDTDSFSNMYKTGFQIMYEQTLIINVVPTKSRIDVKYQFNTSTAKSFLGAFDRLYTHTELHELVLKGNLNHNAYNNNPVEYLNSPMFPTYRLSNDQLKGTMMFTPGENGAPYLEHMLNRRKFVYVTVTFVIYDHQNENVRYPIHRRAGSTAFETYRVEATGNVLKYFTKTFAIKSGSTFKLNQLFTPNSSKLVWRYPKLPTVSRDYLDADPMNVSFSNLQTDFNVVLTLAATSSSITANTISENDIVVNNTYLYNANEIEAMETVLPESKLNFPPTDPSKYSLPSNKLDNRKYNGDYAAVGYRLLTKEYNWINKRWEKTYVDSNKLVRIYNKSNGFIFSDYIDKGSKISNLKTWTDKVKSEIIDKHNNVNLYNIKAGDINLGSLSMFYQVPDPDAYINHDFAKIADKRNIITMEIEPFTRIHKIIRVRVKSNKGVILNAVEFKWKVGFQLTDSYLNSLDGMTEILLSNPNAKETIKAALTSGYELAPIVNVDITDVSGYKPEYKVIKVNYQLAKNNQVIYSQKVNLPVRAGDNWGANDFPSFLLNREAMEQYIFPGHPREFVKGVTKNHRYYPVNSTNIQQPAKPAVAFKNKNKAIGTVTVNVYDGISMLGCFMMANNRDNIYHVHRHEFKYKTIHNNSLTAGFYDKISKFPVGHKIAINPRHSIYDVIDHQDFIPLLVRNGCEYTGSFLISMQNAMKVYIHTYTPINKVDPYERLCTDSHRVFKIQNQRGGLWNSNSIVYTIYDRNDKATDGIFPKVSTFQWQHVLYKHLTSYNWLPRHTDTVKNGVVQDFMAHLLFLVSVPGKTYKEHWSYRYLENKPGNFTEKYGYSVYPMDTLKSYKLRIDTKVFSYRRSFHILSETPFLLRKGLVTDKGVWSFEKDETVDNDTIRNYLWYDTNDYLPAPRELTAGNTTWVPYTNEEVNRYKVAVYNKIKEINNKMVSRGTAFRYNGSGRENRDSRLKYTQYKYRIIFGKDERGDIYIEVANNYLTILLGGNSLGNILLKYHESDAGSVRDRIINLYNKVLSNGNKISTRDFNNMRLTSTIWKYIVTNVSKTTLTNGIYKYKNTTDRVDLDSYRLTAGGRRSSASRQELYSLYITPEFDPNINTSSSSSSTPSSSDSSSTVTSPAPPKPLTPSYTQADVNRVRIATKSGQTFDNVKEMFSPAYVFESVYQLSGYTGYWLYDEATIKEMSNIFEANYFYNGTGRSKDEQLLAYYNASKRIKFVKDEYERNASTIDEEIVKEDPWRESHDLSDMLLYSGWLQYGTINNKFKNINVVTTSPNPDTTRYNDVFIAHNGYNYDNNTPNNSTGSTTIFNAVSPFRSARSITTNNDGIGYQNDGYNPEIFYSPVIVTGEYNGTHVYIEFNSGVNSYMPGANDLGNRSKLTSADVSIAQYGNPQATNLVSFAEISNDGNLYIRSNYDMKFTVWSKYLRHTKTNVFKNTNTINRIADDVVSTRSLNSLGLNPHNNSVIVRDAAHSIPKGLRLTNNSTLVPGISTFKPLVQKTPAVDVNNIENYSIPLRRLSLKSTYITHNVSANTFDIPLSYWKPGVTLTVTVYINDQPNTRYISRPKSQPTVDELNSGFITFSFDRVIHIPEGTTVGYILEAPDWIASQIVKDVIKLK